MIFAELTDKPSVKEILTVLENKFGSVEWADQGTEDSPDAYFWIKRKGAKVSIDNLDSLEFQVKSSHSDTPLIQETIEALASFFALKVYGEPEKEPHE
jgi:hypothetical protein